MTIKKNKTYIFYSRNLDGISYNNYINNRLYDNRGTYQTNNSKKYKFKEYGLKITIKMIPRDVSIFSKGFYLWTYGCYGKNETQSIQLTNSTSSLYNLNLPKSDISWWPEPAKVLNTFSNLPDDTSITIGFSGLLDPRTKHDTFSKNTALGQTNEIYDLMKGLKCISIGGGTLNWTSISINNLLSSIESGQFIKYDAVCYDIETGVSLQFEQLFSASKSKGLIVFVTISHSAPFGFSDATDIMISFFNSLNIDAISPQLYTFDFGTANEYIPNNALSWQQFSDLYAKRKNPNLVVVPSIFSGIKNSSETYDLYNTGGTNDNLVPINYYDPKYTIDTGSNNFLKAYLINSPGYVSWINGNIKPI